MTTPSPNEHYTGHPDIPVKNNAASVVVTYFPQEDVFKSLLSELLKQTDFVIIADNTPLDSENTLDRIIDESDTPGRCLLIKLGKNLGIAKAINIGSHKALSMGADFILLSDQDSQPADDMVSKLLLAYDTESARHERIGAIGPVYTDLHTGLTYPFQCHVPGKFFYGHILLSEQDPKVEALTLITSGTLIPAKAFRQIGPMRENLFIDYVDIEWCHRARAEGYLLLGVGSAKMFHRMGEESQRVWYLGWRNESAYSPLRLYYRTRNYIALCKLGYIDWRWKVRSGWYSLGLIYSHVLFSGKPLEHLRMIGKGMVHGLIGKMDEY